MSLNPVWPVYTKTPYVIQHNKNKLFVHIHEGDNIVEKTFPVTTMKNFSCPDGNGKVIRFQRKICSYQRKLNSTSGNSEMK